MTNLLNKNQELPKIIFVDEEIKVLLGKWLGILTSNTKDNAIIPEKELEKIEREFGTILKSIDIKPEEACYLHQFNKANNSFSCFFYYSDTRSKMTLKYDNYPEEPMSLKLDIKDLSLTYYIYKANKKLKVELNNSSRHDKNTNKKLTCFYGDFINIFTLKNSINTIEINIYYKENISNYISISSIKTFENYLFDLDTSIDLDYQELLRKIEKTYLIPIQHIPKVIIKKDGKEVVAINYGKTECNIQNQSTPPKKRLRSLIEKYKKK